MHASPQPKPKKQFSFHGLRARFMSQSQSRLELPVPPHLDELSRLYPASAPANSKDWDPSQLVDEAYPTLSPSESSATSSPSGKSLPAHPATERRPIPRVHASRYQAPEVFVPDRHRERSQILDPWKERHEATPISFNERNSSVADDYPTLDLPNVPSARNVTVLAPISISFVHSHDAHGALHKLNEGMNDLPVQIPSLLHALEEIAKVHVTISVAVFAFKAAYNMVRTKRDNDKRIMILFVAMEDMFVALLQLQNINDPDILCPGGELLKGRLQAVCERVAGNIKECMNLCDKYQKTKAVIKVMRSQNWETKLTSYISVFAQRRQDFEFAVMIHTTQTLDAMNLRMEDMDRKLSKITSLLLDAYSKDWRPPKEAELAQKVVEMGGLKMVEKSDSALRELAGLEFEHPTARHAAVLASKGSAFTLQSLKDELHEDWESAIRKNMQTFEGKFNLYQRQLKDELSRVMNEGTARVIDELNRGPHDKIKNEELRAIWKDMDWKLNVKARTFVMTLRDHYREKADSASFGQGSTDKWAFEYISAKYLQPIMEAFDDDGSGYVTYQEVNEFVEEIPEELKWTLPHWVAYWAVGWQAISWSYGQKVLGLLNHLFSIRSDLLPENRYWADYYLQNVWSVTFELVKGFRPANLPEHIEAKFQAFADLEEARMRQNLHDIKFDIDALDTVYVVAGPGRIEKYLFPLIYLLLKRDVEIFHVARKTVLHKEELLDSADSLLWVFRAVTYRYLDLCVLFKQNHLNVDSEMKITACGLFEFLHSPSSLWTWHNLKDVVSQTSTVSAVDLPDKDSASGDVLNYEPQNDHRYKCEIYESAREQASEEDMHAPMPVRAILAEWNGFVYDEQQYPTQLMLSFRAHAVSTSDPQRFCATGMHDGISFNVTGRCFQDHDRALHIRFSVIYSKEYNAQYFCGLLDNNLDIVGTVGWEEDPQLHEQRFFLKRNPAAWCLRYRPSPAELREGKARAFWKYALSTIVHRIRRQRLAWSFINERREIGQRYIELSTRFSIYGHSPNAEELVEWTRCKREVTSIDASFFRVLRDSTLKTIPVHDRSCRGCDGKIGGSRVVCLDCLSSESEAKTIDFCDKRDCWEKIVFLDPRNPQKQHLPSHNVLKVRTVLHLLDIPGLHERAQNALSLGSEYLQVPERGRGADAVEDAIAMYYDGASDSGCSTISINGPQCRICRTPLGEACWSCVDCFSFGDETYICDACEQKTMLRCIRCERAFKQPTWYYGSLAADNFMCNTCTARREKPPPVDKQKQHRYTHALVRCSRKIEEDHVTTTRSTEDRMSALEDTVWLLAGKVERMEATLSRLERLLLSSLANGQTFTLVEA